MIGCGLPKMSCVMVTNGRHELVKKSIRCYMQQTYLNKNMVVLSQGSVEQNAVIEHYLKSLGRPDIFFMTAPRDICFGMMRNTSVEIATGDIICQWDDDDLYHPDRLMTQYKALRADSRNIASLYCDFLKYYMTAGELYWCDWTGESVPLHRLLCGSVMFYKRAFGMFNVFYPQAGEQCHVEEDLNVLRKLQTKGTIVPVQAGWQYVYVYHGANVYDLGHHNLTLDTRSGKFIMGARQTG
jgi:glycosyltransferase involved in cell wall biosynthesis